MCVHLGPVLHVATELQPIRLADPFGRSELQLWPQDLPRRALVVLSGEDDLVPSQLVLAQLKACGHPATVMHHPDLGHGGILLAPEFMAEFVARLRAMLAR